MMRPTVDRRTGVIYPPYGVFNNRDYERTQPLDADKIIYSLKANATTAGLIHSNCYTRINSGLVKFLIRETEAKNKIMGTIKGQKMSVEKRIERIMPHEMTTKLFEEMANLRLKPTGSATEINLEMINKRYHKDKFSSLEYLLWRVKELEEELNKRWKRAQKRRVLMLYTTGGVK